MYLFCYGTNVNNAFLTRSYFGRRTESDINDDGRAGKDFGNEANGRRLFEIAFQYRTEQCPIRVNHDRIKDSL